MMQVNKFNWWMFELWWFIKGLFNKEFREEQRMIKHIINTEVKQWREERGG
jgi:hypothetical protein